MFPTEISKENVQQLPLIKFEGRIHLVNSQKDLAKVLEEIASFKVFGFDTETKPTFNKGEYNPTALVQLATPSDAYLIRILDMGITNQLKNFFEDRSTLKVGISIRDDIKDLQKLRPFNPEGFIDLNDVARDLGIRQIGMKSLAGIFLQARVSKTQQTSNWEVEKLSNGQQMYAATDAWVCHEIHQLLLNKGYI